MSDKDSRFDDKLPATPPPSPFRASNTLESLRPRDISWPTATLPEPGYAGAPADVPPSLQGRGLPPEEFNLAPVDWPTAMETMGKQPPPFAPKPAKITGFKTVEQRLEALENRVDGLLDRLAAYNVKASHKL
jgi:hypothetical protein